MTSKDRGTEEEVCVGVAREERVRYECLGGRVKGEEGKEELH